MPEGVRLVIGRRLERVSDDTRKVLTVAAVVGRNFDLSVIEPAAGIDPDDLLDALEEAERAQLIKSAASGREIRYTFSHELIRQTLHTNLSLPRRQRLHLRVAEATEAAHAGATEPQAAALAHHFYQAGSLADAEKTLRYLTTAGQEALSAAAFEDAVAHFTSALSFERLDEKERADLLYKRGWALRSLAQAEDAIADWQAALSAHESLGDAAAVAQTAWDLCWTLLWQNRTADSLAVAERAERVVPGEATSERSRVLALLAGSHGNRGDYDTFEQRITEARRLAEQIGDQRLLGQVLGIQTAMHWTFLKIRRTVDSGRAAVEASRAADDVWELALALAHLGFGLVSSGAPEEACRVADEAGQLAKRVGYDGAAANAVAGRMMATAMQSGDLEAVERLARGIVDTYGRAGPWSFVGVVWLSMGHFWKGAWDEADRYCDEALALGPPETWREWARGWRFVLQASRGDRAWLAEYWQRRDVLFRDGRTLFAGDRFLAFEAVEALAVIGERDEAHRLYARICEMIGDGVVGGYAVTETYAGIASACGEQWETAEQHFETALAQARDIPSKIAQPEARRWYAWMLLDRDAPGDRDKARTLVGEAIDRYREIGMPKHVEIAEKMLREAG